MSGIRDTGLSLRTVLALLVAATGCTKRPTEGASPKPSASASATASLAASQNVLRAEPTRLAQLPISAYATTLALDENATYLLAPHAAYRLVAGEPLHGLELELGIGPAATQSSFIFWSEGAIWKTPKTGGTTRRLATLPLRPQYFVASGEDFAWVSLRDDGTYAIETLESAAPKTLVAASGELSALNIVRDAVYFVERPTPTSWRVGVVRTNGGAPTYMRERIGRRPAMLTGDDAVYYYDVDRFKVRKISLDLEREDDLASEIVCSPMHVSRSIYCGSVEGLFEIARPSNAPRVLSYGRPGSITSVKSDARRVVWTVDIGPDRLAVDTLSSAAPGD